MANRRTLILGSGKHAVQAVEILINHDVDVFLCAKDKVSDELKPRKNDALHIYENADILSLKGCIGDFHVTLNNNGSEINLHVSNILIAEDIPKTASYESNGLKNDFTVIPLSDVDAIISETVTDLHKTVAFLTGISYESHPVFLEEVMRAAISLQSKQDSQVYIFTGNLKVAQNGLETLYRESRKKGVIFVKSDASLPQIKQSENGTVSITFVDNISCETFSLTPDITVVDETIMPDAHLAHLSKIMGLDIDAAGFLQTGNVHRLPVYTNVRGILVAGPARRIQPDADHSNDIQIAANEILSLFDQKQDHTITAEISKGSCIHCLTCIRVCPYKAISLKTMPAVMPDACESCGICAAKCPRQAITLEHLTVQSISDRVSAFKRPASAKTFTPHIIAFCCIRSAFTAYEHARLAEYKLPRGLKVVDVPCGGAISFEHILLTLQSGADGVMITTCHDGNCHGEKGNKYARSNAVMAQDYLVQAGIEKKRVKVTTIAANMGAAFSEEAMAFSAQIKELGPSKLYSNE